MIYLTSQQLQTVLKKKQYYYCYVLFGNNLFLLNDSQDLILRSLEFFNMYERFTFSLDEKSSWDKIFEISHTKSLFDYKKKIFVLTISNIKVNNFFLKKLFSIISYSNRECILCFHINKLTNILKKTFYSYENFEKRIAFIECNTPSHNTLMSWILQRAKSMSITLNESSCKLLYAYYENDLNSLNQILYQLSIIYPKKNIENIHINHLINDKTSHFQILDLLNTILINDRKKYSRILKKLETENTINPLTILHCIQDIIILLIICKRESLYENNQIIFLLNKNKISKNLHILFIKALKNTNLEQLYSVIILLLQTEIIIYKENSDIIWKNFHLVILLLYNESNHI